MPPESAKSKTGDRIDIALRILGILVFLAGIAMIVMVFNWAYDTVSGIDAETLDVQQVSGPVAAEAGEGDVTAEPGAQSLAASGAALGLQFLGILVLGWLGAMVSSKGAQLAIGPRQSGAATEQ